MWELDAQVDPTRAVPTRGAARVIVVPDAVDRRVTRPVDGFCGGDRQLGGVSTRGGGVDVPIALAADRGIPAIGPDTDLPGERQSRGSGLRQVVRSLKCSAPRPATCVSSPARRAMAVAGGDMPRLCCPYETHRAANPVYLVRLFGIRPAIVVKYGHAALCSSARRSASAGARSAPDA